jgi:uncharacterized protein (DUF697 family)
MDFVPQQLFSLFKRFTQNKRQQADEIVKNQVFWAAGAGFLPIPVVDFAVVTAVQLNLVKRLAALYELEWDPNRGKALVTALVSSGAATMGAGALKAIPIVGSLVGGVSMAALAGATTYATGRVFTEHFERGGTLADFDLETAKDLYTKELENGRKLVEDYVGGKKTKPANDAKAEPKPAAKPGPRYQEPASKASQPTQGPVARDKVFLALQELNRAKDAGTLTEEEYERRKRELLDSLG